MDIILPRAVHARRVEDVLLHIVHVAHSRGALDGAPQQDVAEGGVAEGGAGLVQQRVVLEQLK